ncbi:MULTISPECIES: ABC transporter ATP-binding protein [Azospirillum]|uniref:ABC transporter ATP-binding protein n=1 Tax=Azospirillum brasilense TaxID=192 RepID=A0ABU4PEC7_AZOBR|nr:MULTISPECIES: ABC transporter ATP-binding protein [Azospirillum]ALJ39428.1 multidrug ABC transporter ATP-binding protein [Azospirillum brasilense]MDX5955957.1 ABC transporter ATP-binding protein [Azospirillum brasilense]PWC88173.1 multidrug ABC transporter ATPase [Azospirillum sp. Sp 7]
MVNSSQDFEDCSYDELATKHVSVRRVLGLFKAYSTRLIMMLILIVASSALGMASPFLLRAIIDDALPNGDLGFLALLAGSLIVLACLGTVIGVLQVAITSRVGQAIMHDLRVRVYAHLQSLSLGFFMTTRTGEVQSRIASDIGGLQALVTHTASELTRNVSTVVMTIIAMLALEWRLALFSFLVLPAAIWISHRVGKVREEITYEQQLRIADMSSMVQESLSISGIILARTMGRTDHLTRRFVRTSEGVAALEVRSHTAGQWQWAVIDLVLQALPASTLLLGSILMSQGTAAVTIGTMVAMVALQEQLLWPLEEVLRSGVEIRTTRALFARIFDYLDRPVETRERPGPTVLDRKSIRGAIRLHKVSFAYDGSQRPTIDDVSIDIPAGSHVAIVGATGSGKTTLGYLLARLYDVDAGSICYDGVDVRDLSFQSLTDMLGVVPQEPYLLNASIADNLRFARPDASDEDLIAAAKVAQVHEMISALPNGYDTLVGERGYRFSGGEKQRIALARTLLRRPRVLLMDEATSALDPVTERAMSQALETMDRECTTITIAHRLSTVRHADRIFVMDHGQLVEQGRHDELLALGGVYAEMVRSAL